MRVVIHGCVVWLTLALAGGRARCPTRRSASAAHARRAAGRGAPARGARRSTRASPPRREISRCSTSGARSSSTWPITRRSPRSRRSSRPARARPAGRGREDRPAAVPSRTTFLEVQVANGPADIYLNFKARGVACRAEPSCKKALLPGSYKGDRRAARLRALDRPRHRGQRQRSPPADHAGRAAVDARRADRAPRRRHTSTAPRSIRGPIAAGPHQVVVSLDGYREERRAIEARGQADRDRGLARADRAGRAWSCRSWPTATPRAGHAERELRSGPDRSPSRGLPPRRERRARRGPGGGAGRGHEARPRWACARASLVGEAPSQVPRAGCPVLGGRRRSAR